MVPTEMVAERDLLNNVGELDRKSMLCSQFGEAGSTTLFISMPRYKQIK